MLKSLKVLPPTVFAVDFDGTCTGFDFPNIGKDIGAAPVLRELVANGHKIILFTMRSDKANPTSDDPEIICQEGADTNYLSQAVRWFKENKIPLYGVNYNPTQGSWTDSPKTYAHYIIDDTALGCPTMIDPKISDRPFVDWIHIRMMLEARGLL